MQHQGPRPGNSLDETTPGNLHAFRGCLRTSYFFQTRGRSVYYSCSREPEVGYGGSGKVIALLVVCLSILAACVGGSDDSGDAARSVGGEAQAPAPAEIGESFDDAESTSAALPSVGPYVIKNARVDLEVERDGLTDALQSAMQIAAERGGFVFSSSIGGEDDRRASLKFRIPAEEFEGALAELQGLGKVEDQELSGVDVSEEFIDLDARLRNLRAQEDVILGLMDEAVSIDQTIQIQQELTPIQLEIEQIQGRIRFLRDRTSLGTLVLNLREAGVVVARQSQLEGAMEQAVEGTVVVLAGVLLVAGYVIPLTIVALILLLMGRLVYRFVPGMSRRSSEA
jgi:hypothetical protein